MASGKWTTIWKPVLDLSVIQMVPLFECLYSDPHCNDLNTRHQNQDSFEYRTFVSSIQKVESSKYQTLKSRIQMTLDHSTVKHFWTILNPNLLGIHIMILKLLIRLLFNLTELTSF